MTLPFIIHCSQQPPAQSWQFALSHAANTEWVIDDVQWDTHTHSCMHARTPSKYKLKHTYI